MGSPSDNTAARHEPRPAATSVAKYFHNAYVRVLNGSIVDLGKRGGLASAPTWDEVALLDMLRELQRQRMSAYETLDAALAEAREKVTGRAGSNGVDHLARLSAVATEVAAINTLLHWGWVQDDALVKIGAQILEAARPNADRAGDEESEG